MSNDHIKYPLKTCFDDPTITDEVLITAMNEAASLEWERQQKFKKNAHIKEIKVTEVPAKLHQSQERMSHAVGGKEQSVHTQVKVLKTPQGMDKKDSELYEVVKQLRGDRRNEESDEYLPFHAALRKELRMLWVSGAW